MIKLKQVQNVHIKNKADPATCEMSTSEKRKVWWRIGRTSVKNAPRITRCIGSTSGFLCSILLETLDI